MVLGLWCSNHPKTRNYFLYVSLHNGLIDKGVLLLAAEVVNINVPKCKYDDFNISYPLFHL